MLIESPITFFDLETTGANPETAQIIELSYMRIEANVDVKQKTFRIKPSIPIEMGATKAHGITMDMLEGCPSFGEVLSEIHPMFHGTYWCAYNGIRFDFPILRRSFRAHGDEPKSLGSLDPFKVFEAHYGRAIKGTKGQRTLQAAHVTYVGCEFDGAHGAEADVNALSSIFQAQSVLHNITTLSKYHEISLRDFNRADDMGFFVFRGKQCICRTGKHKGKRLQDVPSSYLRWVADNPDFKAEVRKIAADAISGLYPVNMEGN